MKTIMLIALIASLFTTSCATDTGNAQKDRTGRITNAVLTDAFNIVLSTGMAYGSSALQGQNGQDAAQAAFVSAGLSNGSALVGTLITEYAGAKAKPIADVAMAQIAKINPQTPADKALVLNTIGAAIQQAANVNAGS